MAPVPRIACAALALTGLYALLVPAPTLATQGMNLRWTSCLGDGGVQNLNFACTNVGAQRMQGSFVLASDMPQVIGTEIVLELAADSPTDPGRSTSRNASDRRRPTARSSRPGRRARR